MTPDQHITIEGPASNNTFLISPTATIEIFNSNILGSNSPEGVVWNQGDLILDGVKIIGYGTPGAIFQNDEFLD